MVEYGLVRLSESSAYILKYARSVKMRRKTFMFIISLIAVFSVTVGVQNQFVLASEGQQEIELYQKSKQVTVELRFVVIPPRLYFYSSDDGYEGYLGLVSYFFDRGS